jgi:hypothetical protein
MFSLLLIFIKTTPDDVMLLSPRRKVFEPKDPNVTNGFIKK